jgi:putative hydrolase of the HAD superfamily
MASSEDGAYRGLLTDWGGVLTTDLFASFGAFAEREDLPRDAIGRAFRDDPELRELMLGLEVGTVSEEQFAPRLAARLGVDSADLIGRLFAGAGPDEDMREAVRRVHRAGVPTGLVSNSWGTRRYPRDLLAELFDGVVISGEVGIRKPAVQIYTLGAERIGLPPRACVYVDDLSVNLAPATELGMATIHHRTAEQTILQLERLLGVSLR